MSTTLISQTSRDNVYIPRGLVSDRLLLDGAGEPSGDGFFSAVRTDERAATAAAL